MEDALVGFVATGKLDFASLVDAMIADLTRLTLRMAVLGPLAQALSGGASGLGSLISGLFGAPAPTPGSGEPGAAPGPGTGGSTPRAACSRTAASFRSPRAAWSSGRACSRWRTAWG
ncbi:MAG: hypothetical protein HWD60_00090 [Defluviicoccus sp.]|nr:MAG: hypothetical protein HWD60_00090 [Defluviicoccus sp.]